MALCITVACLFVASGTQAENRALHLITSPLPINMVGEPGSTQTADIKIKNGGNAAEKLKVSLMKFSAFKDTGKPMLKDREAGDDFFDWVSFSENEFTIQPNEWKTVTATVKLPESASLGYYYAVVFSRADQPDESSDKAEKVVGAAAVLMLVEAKTPNAKKEMQLAEFFTDKKVYEFLPASFNIRIKNTGNVYASPKGNIFIDKGDSHDLGILDVNMKGGGNVLPNSERVFQAEWNDGFPHYEYVKDGEDIKLDDKGRQIKELKWDFSQANKFRFGKFTANLLLVYDDGQRDVPVEGTVTFWVIPWRILGGLLLILAFVGLGVRSVVKSLMSKKSDKKDKKEKKK